MVRYWWAWWNMTFPSLPGRLNDSCCVTCLGCLERIHAAHTSAPAPTAGETNILRVFLPPRSWQMWKGLPGLGTKVTDALQSVVAAVGFWCRIVPWTSIPSPSWNVLYSLISSLKNLPPLHSVAWPHYPAKVVLSFKIAVNHRLHATVAYLRTWSVGLLHSWSYVLCFPACCVAAKCTVSALHLVLIRIIR